MSTAGNFDLALDIRDTENVIRKLYCNCCIFVVRNNGKGHHVISRYVERLRQSFIIILHLHFVQGLIHCMHHKVGTNRLLPEIGGACRATWQ